MVQISRACKFCGKIPQTKDDVVWKCYVRAQRARALASPRARSACQNSAVVRNNDGVSKCEALSVGMRAPLPGEPLGLINGRRLFGLMLLWSSSVGDGGGGGWTIFSARYSFDVLVVVGAAFCLPSNIPSRHKSDNLGVQEAAM